MFALAHRYNVLSPRHVWVNIEYVWIYEGVWVGTWKNVFEFSANFQALSLKQFYIHENIFFFNLIDILKVFLKFGN